MEWKSEPLSALALSKICPSKQWLEQSRGISLEFSLTGGVEIKWRDQGALEGGGREFKVEEDSEGEDCVRLV